MNCLARMRGRRRAFSMWPSPSAGVADVRRAISFRARLHRKAVAAGWRTAICDQVGEVQAGKLVRREVSQVLSAGHSWMILDWTIAVPTILQPSAGVTELSGWPTVN